MIFLTNHIQSYLHAARDIHFRGPNWLGSARYNNIGGADVAHIGYHEYSLRLLESIFSGYNIKTKLLNLKDYIKKDFSVNDRVFGKLVRSEKYSTDYKFVYEMYESLSGGVGRKVYKRSKNIYKEIATLDNSEVGELFSNILVNVPNNSLESFRGILKREYTFSKPYKNEEIGNYYYENEFLIKSKLIQSGLFEQYISYNFTYIHTQLLVMVGLAAVLYFLSKILSKKIFNLDKKSAYECGFEPFLILTTSIEISFILVAFIFLIFDLELIFLSGFLISNGSIGSFGILLVIIYLSSVWIMVFLEVFTGVLSWPVWNIYRLFRSDMDMEAEYMENYFNYHMQFTHFNNIFSIEFIKQVLNYDASVQLILLKKYWERVGKLVDNKHLIISKMYKTFDFKKLFIKNPTNSKNPIIIESMSDEFYVDLQKVRKEVVQRMLTSDFNFNFFKKCKSYIVLKILFQNGVSPLAYWIYPPMVPEGGSKYIIKNLISYVDEDFVEEELFWLKWYYRAWY